MVEGEAGGSSPSDDDLIAGPHVHGAVLIRIGSGSFLAADARLVAGTSVAVFRIDTDADCTKLSALLGCGRQG